MYHQVDEELRDKKVYKCRTSNLTSGVVAFFAAAPFFLQDLIVYCTRDLRFGQAETLQNGAH